MPLPPIITAEEVQTYMQRPVSASAAALAALSASGAVRAHCGWNLTREAMTFETNGNGTRILSLSTLHLIAVDEVKVDGLVIPLPRWSQRGQLYREKPWPDFQRIEVTAVHGYDPIPDVVKVVALGFAARQVGNPERFKTASVGSVSRTFDLTLLDESLLHPYRLFTTS